MRRHIEVDVRNVNTDSSARVNIKEKIAKIIRRR